jgi:hypothetical protein
MDIGNRQYVGWEEQIASHPLFKDLWSNETLTQIQKHISNLLLNYYPNGLIVPTKIIGDVLYSCYQNYTPQVGDIYSRYIQPSEVNERRDRAQIIDQCINIIVSQIKDEYDTMKKNEKLTVWDTILGEFNNQGLRAHPPIKVRNRRPDPMRFNMNY